ncbi:MAG: biotin--[acetyl-CoA-carboxylase] ligase [Planctomycetota bacterium]
MSLDFDTIRKLPWPTIELYQQLDSTNDRALELARDPTTEAPGLVVTREQTHGRGQQGRSWQSTQQSLTFSWFHQMNADARLSIAPGLIPIAAGLCVLDALGSLLPELSESMTLKWPNDVLIYGRKVSGILVESVPLQTSRRVVVGIGVNVNQTMKTMASFVQEPNSLIATSLIAERTRKSNSSEYTNISGNTPNRPQLPIDLTTVLTKIVSRLGASFADQDRSLAGSDEIAARAFSRFSYLNEKIEILGANNEISVGVVESILPDGGLVLRTDEGGQSGKHTVYSGSIRRLDG